MVVLDRAASPGSLQGKLMLFASGLHDPIVPNRSSASGSPLTSAQVEPNVTYYVTNPLRRERGRKAAKDRQISRLRTP